MSRFGLPARTTPVPRHPPGSVGTLRVTTAFPQVTHTRPGRTLRFLITLSNPTHTTVRLAPCPSYPEGIYAVGYVHREWHFLNCDTVYAIPPGHRVRSQMRIAITAAAPPGAAKFAWQLDTPTQPSAVRVLVIRPAA